MNRIYYKEVSLHNILNDEQINEVYKKYIDDEETLINHISKSNLKLVIYIAKQYKKAIKGDSIITMDDLISEGNVGMITACKKYKFELGVKFSSYAAYWIRSNIQSFIIKNTSSINLPFIVHRTNVKIEKAINELYNDNEGEITKENIEALGIFKSKQIDEYFSNKQVLSLDNQFSLEDKEDIIFEDDVEIKRKISIALKRLIPKEKEVITLLYGLNDTIIMKENEIAIELGISRQRVNQIKNSALSKLHNILHNKI